MNIFRRPDYTSEATQFIRQLKKDNPNLEAQQRQSRALLWAKKVDRDARADFASARSAQHPYVSQTDNS